PGRLTPARHFGRNMQPPGGALKLGKGMNQRSDDFPRQLPLGFAVAPAFAADDLVATASNRAAIRMVEAWPAWPAPVVVLSGPEGSGKSHLATFWKQRSEATLL